ncbi:hypothetical protein R1sor_013172 [Riccia sorocarpa]|uniref:Uncharacterized protein n=1 Tax=Riccia sorocarpa TaxID=122646 RepID=A0ABD3H5Y5_9MARC
MILLSILGDEGKILVAECDHQGLQLKTVFHDGFDYFYGKHSVVVDKVTGEQVGGIFQRKIPGPVLDNMRDLLLVLHRVKPPVRKVEDKKMCSAGPYVASRFKKRKSAHTDGKSAHKDGRALMTDLEEEKIDLKGEQVATEDNVTIKVKGEQEAKQTCMQGEEEE